METSQNPEKNTDEVQKPHSSALRSVLNMTIKAAIAVGILLWLVHTTGDKAKDWLTRLHDLRFVWLVPAAILYAFHIFVNAWRWHLLLKVRGIPCSLANAFSLTMQSFFFSLVMPGGAIGGDVVRAGFLARALPKNRVFDGVFTILMDRFTGMLGIFSLCLLILPFSWRFLLQQTDGLARTCVWILTAAALGGLLAGIAVFRHRDLEKLSFFQWGTRLADRFTGNMYTKIADTLDAYRGASKEIALCVLSGITGVNLSLGFVMYFVCLAFFPASEVSFIAALAAITFGNIAGLIPLTPSGVGMRDYLVMSILSASMFPGDPLLPAILMTLFILGFNLLGGLFFLGSKHPKAEPVSCGRAEDSGRPGESDTSTAPRQEPR